MTDTFEQKKIEEFRNKFVKESIGGDYVIALQYPQKFESFLLETIRQARIEGSKEIKDYCKKTLIDLSTLPRPEKDMAEAINERVIQIIDWIDSLHSDIREKEMV